MKNKLIVAGMVVLLLVVGVVAMNSGKKTTDHGMDMTTHAQTNPKASTGMMDTNQITYEGFAVTQPLIRVKKGTTVTWTNKDDAKHDVTPDMPTAEFKEGPLFGKGETYSMTFNVAGTYSYHCSPHPYMKGTIEVTE